MKFCRSDASRYGRNGALDGMTTRYPIDRPMPDRGSGVGFLFRLDDGSTMETC